MRWTTVHEILVNLKCKINKRFTSLYMYILEITLESQKNRLQRDSFFFFFEYGFNVILIVQNFKHIYLTKHLD